MLDQSLSVLLLHDWHDLTVQRYVLSIVTPPLVELRELLSLFNVYRESLNESLAPKLLSKDTELSVDIFKCYLKTYFFRSLLTARRSSALKTALYKSTITITITICQQRYWLQSNTTMVSAH